MREQRKLGHARKVGDRELLKAQPLTHAPMVRRGFVNRLAEWLLDVWLRSWWWLVRPLVS